MTAIETSRKPVSADEHERAMLAELDTFLTHQRGSLLLVDKQGEGFELPESVRGLLHEMIQALAQARPIAVVELERQLTLRQAADLLDVPVSHLVRLLHQGDIPLARDRPRRVRFGDVQYYKNRRDAERHKALTELARMGQEIETLQYDVARGGRGRR